MGETPAGEASVPLKPNDRSDRYLRRVRELLSGHVLGSPSGYPVHLTRWTWQGQAGISSHNCFFHAMLDKGFYLAPSAFEAGFVSAAHSDEDIAATVAAAREVFAAM